MSAITRGIKRSDNPLKSRDTGFQRPPKDSRSRFPRPDFTSNPPRRSPRDGTSFSTRPASLPQRDTYNDRSTRYSTRTESKPGLNRRGGRENTFDSQLPASLPRRDIYSERSTRHSARTDSKPGLRQRIGREKTSDSQRPASLYQKDEHNERSTFRRARHPGARPRDEGQLRSGNYGMRNEEEEVDSRNPRAKSSYERGNARNDQDRSLSSAAITENLHLRMETMGSMESVGETVTTRLQERAYRPLMSKNPPSIIRSTAASEFIYGRSSVLAALKAGKRKIYNLYLSRTSEDEDKSNAEEICKHASNSDTKITWLHGVQGAEEMDKVVKGRPHNGVILEAGPLPKLPVSALRQASKGQSFNVQLRHQNEDEKLINGSNSEIVLNSTFRRYPFVVMLDEVIDQGNLGGILRSAYFLGADAVVLSSHMAVMNAVTLKAASGAAEDIRILSVHNTTGFLESSKENGWSVYAAVAPPSSTSNYKSRHVELSDLKNPLQESACILLLGGEGNGLRRDLVRIADRTISIPGQRNHDSGVDSLNVSVAAGILINGFLKEPSARNNRTGNSSGDPNVLF